METKSSHVPYVEYDFYETQQPTAPEPTLMYGTDDGEYLYEKPNASRLRQTIFSSQEVVYYDVEPDYFEPEAEYIVERPAHAEENLPKHSTETEKGSQSRKKVIQDVYDEDGYTLARPDSYDVEETNLQRNTSKQEETNQLEGVRKKKIAQIVIVIICTCIAGGIIAGISIFALGNNLFTKRFRDLICLIGLYI